MSKPIHSPLAPMSCDVLVVGYGAAGACAALEAHQKTSDVLIVDAAGGGGASAISGGVYYAGGGTDTQNRLDVKDSSEKMEQYLRFEVQEAVSAATLKSFCQESVANFRWLCGHGLRFKGRLFPYKSSYPPRGVGLYFSGNEEKWSPEQSAPIPRGHVSTGPVFSPLKGLGSGQFFNPLDHSIKSKNIGIRLCCRAEELIQEKGVITGIKAMALPEGMITWWTSWCLSWSTRLRFRIPPLARVLKMLGMRLFRDYARPLTITARKGVVLTTGGFIFKRDMVQKYAPAYRRCLPLGTPNCDGKGMRMAQQKGAVLKRMHKISAWRFINPPRPWIFGMLVGQDGKRFCDEAMYGSAIGRELCEKQRGVGYLIVDKMVMRQALRDLVPWRTRLIQYAPAWLTFFFYTWKANDIHELAKKIKVPPEVLNNSLETYNAAARLGRDKMFGKQAKDMRVLAKMPLYAVDISLRVRSLPCAAITLGGIDVDEKTGGARKADGTIIKGLYAAGRAAVGVASENYLTGLALADCVFSGRRAGKYAASSSSGGNAQKKKG